MLFPVVLEYGLGGGRNWEKEDRQQAKSIDAEQERKEEACKLGIREARVWNKTGYYLPKRMRECAGGYFKRLPGKGRTPVWWWNWLLPAVKGWCPLSLFAAKQAGNCW